MSKITKIDYATLEKDTIALAQKIKLAYPDLSNIELVCISRGGLFVGGLLSYLLEIKKTHTICLESYDSSNSNAGKEVTELLPFELPVLNSTSTYLFVDDVNDTSKTFQYIKELCSAKKMNIDFIFATTYHKLKDNQVPHFYSKELPGHAWIEFPWDTAVDSFQLASSFNFQSKEALLELGLEDLRTGKIV